MISKELLLEIMPLDLNEKYDKYYESKIGGNINAGYYHDIFHNGKRVGFGAKYFNIYESSDKAIDWIESQCFLDKKRT